jgi:uncharacterized DUF497 family protein
MNKTFQWDPEKNIRLVQERQVSFEKVVSLIQTGQLLDTIEHPNLQKYPNQKVFIVKFDDYVYMVPFVEDETSIFLKTIIPSRKMKRQYLGD